MAINIFSHNLKPILKTVNFWQYFAYGNVCSKIKMIFLSQKVEQQVFLVKNNALNLIL